MPEPMEALHDDDHDILMTQRNEDRPDSADASDSLEKMPPEIKRYL